MRTIAAVALALAWGSAVSAAQSPAAPPGDACRDVITIETHARTTTRYALAYPRGQAADPMALVLLVGGGGHLGLDDKGCPRALKGNMTPDSSPSWSIRLRATRGKTAWPVCEWLPSTRTISER